MIKEEKYSRLVLSEVKRFNLKNLKEVVEVYGGALSFLEALAKTPSNKVKLPDEDTISWCYEKDTNEFVVFGEDNYPSLLSHAPDAPFRLFKRGDIEVDWKRTVSIVGTRFSTRGAEELAFNLASELSTLGYTVVSGMAKGIDTAAHKGALAAKGKTVAVLGTGVQQPYPRSNIQLYEEIIQKGLVVSEYDTVPHAMKFVFPRRNRIIAGLAPITIVVQAPSKSGALITARLAFDYNREVYAVPGDLNDYRYTGCNRLLHSNIAQIFIGINEFTKCLKQDKNLNDFEIQMGEKLGANELKILRILEKEAYGFDHLQESVNIRPADLSTILTKLELHGIVAKNLAGFYTVQT